MDCANCPWWYLGEFLARPSDYPSSSVLSKLAQIIVSRVSLLLAGCLSFTSREMKRVSARRERRGLECGGATCDARPHGALFVMKRELYV